MSLISIINPDLKPWNIFNNHRSPDLTVSGNVIIDGKEWFNSYLSPPPQSVHISDAGWMFDSLKHFFAMEEKILLLNQPHRDLKFYLLLLYLSINLTQAYLDPVEAIATRKRWPKRYKTINKLLDITSKQIDSLTRYFSLETIIFPLIIFNNQNLDSRRSVFNKTADLLMCSTNALNGALTRINGIFQPTKFMDKYTASEIINNSAGKVNIFIKPEDQFNYDLQTISSIITWSKYIGKRFSATNQTLKYLLNHRDVADDFYLMERIKSKSTSGSEKYGIAIFLLTYLFNKDPLLKLSVVGRAKQIVEAWAK